MTVARLQCWSGISVGGKEMDEWIDAALELHPSIPLPTALMPACVESALHHWLTGLILPPKATPGLTLTSGRGT